MKQQIYCLIIFSFMINTVRAQCLSGNCTNGLGKFKYKNEDIYEGTFKDGYANGKGKMLYSRPLKTL